MPDTTHEGNDPMGALTTHRGPLETCPAPDCQDRLIEQDDEDQLTDVQKAYNLAQYEMFQLAAYGHHRYHPLVESLTPEGKRQERDYNDRLLKARDDLEAGLLRLVAEHGERYRTLPQPVVGWLRTLADDPGELSMLAIRPDERDEILDGQPAAGRVVSAAPTHTGLRDRIAEADEEAVAALFNRIAEAARTVPLRLGPNAVDLVRRGETIVLNLAEADEVAAAVLAVLPPADRAAVERVRAVLETEAVVGRSALEYRGLILAALMAAEAQQQPDTETPRAYPDCERCGDTGIDPEQGGPCTECQQPAADGSGEEA
ncbi:hypothetical protein [Streptomyces sp. AS02]|uniref:hypothetical protein n=1 Tax=Streptomyces sp. AS02 TaxID=2938946 RepID=UPI002020480E|nr:hypothetical protein [Streptomyces sp. AS02]MCL8016889.1 hypothetical protein [Streptomyces sp. AS02]